MERLLGQALKILQEAGMASPLLTDLETRTLELLSQGFLQKQVAGEMGITYSTVKSNVMRLRKKLGAKNVTQAVTLAKNLGLI